jgi:NDP-sugar pyrophosphorylase family protein
MKVIILAGGVGRRLLPYTVVLPKPLMPVGDFPILEIMIRQLKKHRLTDIVLAVGHLGNLIESFFGNGRKFGVRIKYSYEDVPLGTAGPLTEIKGLNRPFMVMNGDLLTLLDYSKLISYHRKARAIATIATQKRSIQIDFGVIKSNSHNLVTQYIEKPDLHYQVSMGAYVFQPEILKYIPKGRKMDFPELVNLLLQKRQKVSTFPSSDFWLDIGRPDDYARAVEAFLKIKRKLL